MSSITCLVCNEAPSKYKCPHCDVRYCSIKCFKTHVQSHESSDMQDSFCEVNLNQESPKIMQASAAIDTEQQEALTNPYEALQAHPNFSPLFTRYPNLRSQLQRIYTATQNPYKRSGGEDDSMGEDEEKPRKFVQDRVRGKWTQDRADEMAADVLMKLRKEDEGVREFMGLVNAVFARKEDVG